MKFLKNVGMEVKKIEHAGKGSVRLHANDISQHLKGLRMCQHFSDNAFYSCAQ